ncbi:unnamed protein product [Rhizoctonia solani]|uniref:Uncharacterized protein n=1 Tax=Rhizoctonia solani TaxID=456999 RepID=A0A8H3ECD4_9AGAM|nr:unnamed protein product [Rhizoctonia solani]
MSTGLYTGDEGWDLETITSGNGDGYIIVHDLSTQRHLIKFPGAPKGTVSAITYAEGPRLLSCGVDRTVKLWDTLLRPDKEEGTTRGPLNVFPGKVAFKQAQSIVTERTSYLPRRPISSNYGTKPNPPPSRILPSQPRTKPSQPCDSTLPNHPSSLQQAQIER